MARIKVTGYIDTSQLDPSEIDPNDPTGLANEAFQELFDLLSFRLSDIEVKLEEG